MTEVSRRSLLLVAGTAMVAPGTAFAHHGFTGRYDAARPIYLAGHVLNARFRRPHPVVDLEADNELRLPSALPDAGEFAKGLVVRAEDHGRVVCIEYPPIGLFFDLAGRIAQGDRIATIVFQNCRPPHQLRGQWIMLADGTTIVRRGRMQAEDAGCSM